ncbi:MAG: carboxy-S-adenosyl-L-methionine synthase CmoA [Candidatus Omnitrophica bacterium]|nr:carboxy-S-adenosyl-L-methionine synthase CmoA [Candidatus Omnitrophota bacterium]
MENPKKDSLYADKQNAIKDFVFDANVADVFEDMIKRSVPGYVAIVAMIGCLAEEYVGKGTHCYDLGCSLGEVSMSIANNVQADNVKIIAVDNSEAMVEKCRTNLEKIKSRVPVDIVCNDIKNVDITNASMVVLNFTLQFVEQDQRRGLLQKIYDGLCPGGILVISEKIIFKDEKEQELQIKLHETFKKINGYSELEIAQKRTALENVLRPDSMEEHMDRLRSEGFKNIHVWFQCFNFVSMVAFK